MATQVIREAKIMGRSYHVKGSLENRREAVAGNFVFSAMRRMMDVARGCSHARQRFYSYKH